MLKLVQKNLVLPFILASFMVFAIVIMAALFKRNDNITKYDKAEEYIHSEDYDKAIDILKDVKYEDSEILVVYLEARDLLSNEKYEEAIDKLVSIQDFRDSKEQIQFAKYNLAIQYFENKDYDMAKQLFKELNGYEDSKTYLEEIDKEQLVQITENIYNMACDLLEKEDYEKALENFNLILGYKDSEEKAEICKRYIRG